MLTSQQVEDSLTLLGSESHIIASHLMVKGVRGLCEEASNCAIAVFLDNEFPDYEFSVEGDIKAFKSEGFEYLFTIEPSEQVQHFIEEFDAGAYPSLIEHEVDCDGFTEEDTHVACDCGYVFSKSAFGSGDAKIKPEAQMTIEEIPDAALVS